MYIMRIQIWPSIMNNNVHMYIHEHHICMYVYDFSMQWCCTKVKTKELINLVFLSKVKQPSRFPTILYFYISILRRYLSVDMCMHEHSNNRKSLYLGTMWTHLFNAK